MSSPSLCISSAEIESLLSFLMILPRRHLPVYEDVSIRNSWITEKLIFKFCREELIFITDIFIAGQRADFTGDFR